MSSLFKKWINTPDSGDLFSSVRENKYITGFFRAIRINKLLNKLLKELHIRTKRWIMESKYGQKLREEITGQLTVQGVIFNLYDPLHWYLPDSPYLTAKTYEPAVTHLLKALIKKKSCFLDIGSQSGFFTVFVGSLNKDCEIHSFEPNSEYFFVTKYNVDLNNLDVNLYCMALSDETAEIPLFGGGMKVKENERYEMVNALPFDNLAQKENIHPDIIKLDVHGGEGKVLFGMKKALKDDINHLFLELHTNELLVGYSMKQVIDLLLESGFLLYEFNRFRYEDLPEVTKITGLAYDNLTNQDKWTHLQTDQMRMIFATKNPEEFAYD